MNRRFVPSFALFNNNGCVRPESKGTSATRGVWASAIAPKQKRRNRTDAVLQPCRRCSLQRWTSVCRQQDAPYDFDWNSTLPDELIVKAFRVVSGPLGLLIIIAQLVNLQLP